MIQITMQDNSLFLCFVVITLFIGQYLQACVIHNHIDKLEKKLDSFLDPNHEDPS